MNPELNANVPEWYTPSQTDVLKKIEVQQVETTKLVAPSVVPQVHLSQLPLQQDLQKPLEPEIIIPVLDSREIDSGSIHIINESKSKLKLSPLEEGGKLQGDKLKSDWQVAQEARDIKDWRQQPLKSKDEQSKVHGDALFESSGNRSQQWSQEGEYKQSESLAKANFGKLSLKEEDLSKQLNGQWSSQQDEISRKIQGDALFNASNASASFQKFENKSGKVQGDKLFSSNTASFSNSNIEDESRKIQGDALFDSTGSDRSKQWDSSIQKDWKQSDKLDNANFGKLQGQEEILSKQLNGEWNSKEIPSKIEGDALFNASESSSANYTKLPLSALRSNSQTLEKSWSPSVDRSIKDFDEAKESEWSQKLDFEPVKQSEIKNEEEENWNSVDRLFSDLAEIRRLEEIERQDRIQRGVNPVLQGKVHRFQQELLHHNSKFLESLPLPAMELPHIELPKVSEISHNVVDSIKATTWTWSSYLKENVLNKTKNIYSQAKEGLGYYDISSIKSEERERVRKMNEKVDPMIDARKRRVEEELLHAVKSAN